MNFTLINQFIFFLIASFGLWLAFWVYFAERENKINKYFFWMVLIWILGEMTPYFIFRSFVLSQRIILFLPKIEVASVFIFFIFFYFFSLFFLNERKKFQPLSKFVLLTAIVGAFLAIFTNLFQKSVEISEEGIGIDLVLTTEGKIIWLGFVVLLTLFIFIRFFRKYFISSQREKLKIQYFLVGISIWIIINLVFNVYFPLVQNTFRYAYLGNYSIIFLFAFTALAIVKRELFGIRVVVTTIFVGLIGILLALDALIFTSQIYLQLLKGLILIVFLYFGYLLIRSVIEEIKRREEIEKLSRAKSEFISIASHQLRTPLTAIKGYISMLLEGTYGELPGKAKKPVEAVYKSNERLVDLVNNLLNISRIESGKIEMELKKSSLEDLISSVVNELKIEAEMKGIYLKFKKPKSPLPKILLDKEKMRQSVANLIDNSIKYTEKGGVTVEVKELKSKVQIIVTDTGVGLTEEEISKMFESFSRGMAGTRLYTQGAGLGLYIARRFIEMHQGKVWGESEGKNKGATFYIELPMR